MNQKRLKFGARDDLEERCAGLIVGLKKSKVKDRSYRAKMCENVCLDVSERSLYTANAAAFVQTERIALCGALADTAVC